MKKINYFVICFLLLFSCQKEENKSTKGNLYENWEFIYIDLGNTEKRFLLSSQHDTLSITNFIWQTKEKPNGEEYKVREPDSRLRLKLDKEVKKDIVSEVINLFKNPQSFQLNVTDYAGIDAYIVILQQDAEIVYSFPYNPQIELQPELVNIFRLLNQEVKQHPFKKL